MWAADILFTCEIIFPPAIQGSPLPIHACLFIFTNTVVDMSLGLANDILKSCYTDSGTHLLMYIYIYIHEIRMR